MLIPKRYVFRIRLHSVRFYLRGRRCDCQRSIPWRGCFPRPLDQILAYRLDDHDVFRLAAPLISRAVAALTRGY